MSEEAVVRGEIVFEDKPALPPGAVIRLTLRDTGLADAPSQVVAERTLEGAAREANERGRVAFELPLGGPRDERGSYTLSVHVASEPGAERFRKGDYINMQSYPVSATRPPQDLSVLVKRIRA